MSGKMWPLHPRRGRLGCQEAPCPHPQGWRTCAWESGIWLCQYDCVWGILSAKWAQWRFFAAMALCVGSETAWASCLAYTIRVRGAQLSHREFCGGSLWRGSQSTLSLIWTKALQPRQHQWSSVFHCFIVVWVVSLSSHLDCSVVDVRDSILHIFFSPIEVSNLVASTLLTGQEICLDLM